MSLLKVYGGESNQSGGDEDDGRIDYNEFVQLMMQK